MSKTEILNSRKQSQRFQLNNLLIPSYREIKDPKSYKFPEKDTAKVSIIADKNL